ncbi:MAG: prephenate dehydrogenase/arogenate dehydrogenase family protein [Acetivibrionales bacterium]|jgi:prephenate dehydrogenase
MTVSVKKIGIIGLGLIGGSIARALKRSEKGYIIKAWDKDKKILDCAMSEKVIDECTLSVKGNFFECDVIFLCIPVFAMKDILNDLLFSISPDCILTDVGSTKSDVVATINEMKVKNPFIGGHPLAGSEKSGFRASRANLFENAYYCLTPEENTDKDVLIKLRDIIDDLGAIPIEMTPMEHDRVTAAISHVPHIIAASLVNLIDELDSPDSVMKTISAGGFKDLTRIASASPGLWAGICLSNKERILETISAFKNGLERFENDLRSNDRESVEKFFTSARELRNSLSDRKSIFQKTYAIVVDVDDKPGIIALISSALANKNINIKNIGILNSRETEEGALEIQFESEESRIQGLETLSRLGYGAKPKD